MKHLWSFIITDKLNYSKEKILEFANDITKHEQQKTGWKTFEIKERKDDLTPDSDFGEEGAKIYSFDVVGEE